MRFNQLVNRQRLLKALWFSSLLMLACLLAAVFFVMFSPSPWSAGGDISSFFITNIQRLISWPFGFYDGIFPNNQCIIENSDIVDGKDLCGLSVFARIAGIVTLFVFYTFLFYWLLTIYEKVTR